MFLFRAVSLILMYQLNTCSRFEVRRRPSGASRGYPPRWSRVSADFVSSDLDKMISSVLVSLAEKVLRTRVRSFFFPLTEGCSEGLDAFRFFCKHYNGG